MGWDKLADLGAGIWNKWFSKEATEEQRANAIEKLEEEQRILSKKNSGGIYNRRLSIISKQLRQLNKKAKNSR